MIRDFEYNRRRWVIVELRKSRAKRVIDIYVKMMLSGKTDLNKLSEMYRPDSLKPIATLNRFLKQKEVKEVINQKLDEALKLHGIDVDFVLKKRKDILEGSMKKEDYSNANRVLESFEEKLDMKPKESKFITTTETNYIELLERSEPKQLSEGNNIQSTEE